MSVSLLLGVPGKIKKVATDTAKIITDTAKIITNVGTLLSRLTAARAAKLDKLDNIAVVPRCSLLEVRLNTSHSSKWMGVSLGYTVKNTSKAAVIVNVGVKYAGSSRNPPVRWSAARNAVEIYLIANVNNSSTAEGTVTVIDYNP